MTIHTQENPKNEETEIHGEENGECIVKKEVNDEAFAVKEDVIEEDNDNSDKIGEMELEPIVEEDEIFTVKKEIEDMPDEEEDNENFYKLEEIELEPT